MYPTTPLPGRYQTAATRAVKGVLIALLATVLAGCSVWNQPELFAYIGQGLDTATTGYLVCDLGGVEANSIYGDSCEETLLLSILLKGGFLSILHLMCDPEECPAAYRVAGGIGFGAAAWNTYVALEN